MILAVYQQCGSFKRAGQLCNCGPDTFRRRFLEFGHVAEAGNHGNLFWDWVLKGAYRKVSRVPDKCPRTCPGRLDCIEPGRTCIFPMQFDKDSNL